MRTKSVMPAYSRVFAVACALVILAGCAVGPKIHSDYDADVDFGRYETYGFFSPLGIESANDPGIQGAVFRDAIGKEMESRGYVHSAAPDLLINVSGRFQGDAKATTESGRGGNGNYYHYRRGFYDPWHGYTWAEPRHIDGYTHGTVNVDLVDRERKLMVWEGVAVGRVSQENGETGLREAIYAGIAELFAGYPFRPGQ